MIFNVIVFRTVTEVHGFYGSSLSFLSKMVLLLFRTSFLFCIPSAKFICPPLVIPDVLICVWTLMLPDDRFNRSLLLLYFQFGTLVPLFGSLCSLQVLLLFDLFFGGGFFRSYDIAHGDKGFAVNCHRSPWQYGHENNLWQANRNYIKAASLSLTGPITLGPNERLQIIVWYDVCVCCSITPQETSVLFFYSLVFQRLP